MRESEKLAAATLPGKDRIFRLGDWSADNDKITARMPGFLRRCNSLLVTGRSVCKADTGGYGQKMITASLMYDSGFQRRTDYAVEAGCGGILGIGENNFIHRFRNQKNYLSDRIWRLQVFLRFTAESQ